MVTAKKKGLGRGLEALLGGPAEIVETAKQEGAPTVLRVDQLQPGKYQPLSLIHISEPTRPRFGSRMPSSA